MARTDINISSLLSRLIWLTDNGGFIPLNKHSISNSVLVHLLNKLVFHTITDLRKQLGVLCVFTLPFIGSMIRTELKLFIWNRFPRVRDTISRFPQGVIGEPLFLSIQNKTQLPLLHNKVRQNCDVLFQFITGRKGGEGGRWMMKRVL